MADIQITPSEINDFENKVRCVIHLNDPSFGENKLYIYRFDPDYEMCSGSWTLPKIKPVDLKYVTEKYNSIFPRTHAYKNLRHVFENLKIKGAIYYTSFGFSYDCFFKSQKTFDQEVLVIQNHLRDLHIQFKNEYSDARWVYRFIISKSKANLEIISNLDK